MMKKDLVIEVISMLFVLLFVYTSLSKLLMFSIYMYDLDRSPELRAMAPFLSVMVPLSELVISGLLIFQRTRKAGMWGALGLMTLFTIYVAYVLSITTHRPCTCGGIIRQLSWRNHFIFNIVFTLLAATGLWLLYRKKIEAGPLLKS